MADTRETNKLESMNKNPEKHYIREQIVEKKRKPIRILIRMCIWFLTIVVMGGTIGVSYALMNNWLNESSDENETKPSHTVGYGDDSSEFDIENSDEYMTGEFSTENNSISQEWLDAYLAMRKYTLKDIKALENTLKSLYITIQKSIITIQVSRIDENNNLLRLDDIVTISGIVVSVTETEVVLLADGNLFDENSILTAYANTFKERTLEVRAKDKITGMTTLVMSLENFPENDYKQLKAIMLGNSKNVSVGQNILFLGSPNGFAGSLQYGYVTYVERNQNVVDGEQAILWTDCTRVANSSGAMFNLNGELIGWIDTTSSNTNSVNGLQSAIGITDLKHIVEDIVLGKNSAYLGVKGCSVTDSMVAKYSLPKGIYVTDVELGSVAYESGIQIGDVITKINDVVSVSMPTLQNILANIEEQEEMTIVIQRKGKDGYKERTFTLKVQGR